MKILFCEHFPKDLEILVTKKEIEFSEKLVEIVNKEYHNTTIEHFSKKIMPIKEFLNYVVNNIVSEDLKKELLDSLAEEMSK